jgi:hypothetical protein
VIYEICCEFLTQILGQLVAKTQFRGSLNGPQVSNNFARLAKVDVIEKRAHFVLIILKRQE